MKLWLPLWSILALSALAAPAVLGRQAESNLAVLPPLPESEEFFWDDGLIASGWCWYTGGNYWAVQFDDTKTGGVGGTVTRVGAAVYPGWPDGTYHGAYIHIFADQGGYPGDSVGCQWLDSSSGYGWVDCEIAVSTGTFYEAFRQYGDYPACDALGTDAYAGTHDWTGYQGGWGSTTSYGDFMLRCYWEADTAVTEATWGRVKALY